MGLNPEISNHNPASKREFPWPRKRDKAVSVIPQEVLHPLIKRDIQYAVNRGYISDTSIDTFIKDHVTGYMVDGVRVLLINHEFDNDMVGVRHGDLHDGARLIINSDTTYAVGVEYFMPEIRRNARKVPFFGPRFIKDREQDNRLVFAKRLAQQVEASQKPLFVADTGNNANIAIGFTLPPALAAFEFLVGLAGLTFNLPMPDIMKDPRLLIASAAYILALSNARGASVDHEKIHPFLQRFGLTVDDSRRIFVAAGIKQMVREVKKNDPNGIKDRQLVVVYPKAHTMAIGDYMQHPHKIKRFLYRLRFDIPHRTRVYNVDRKTQGVNKGNSFDGWRRVSNRRMPLFA